MKILIVEDDFPSQQLLAFYTKSYGHADLVGDGQEAVRIFQKALMDKIPYDLVLLDIMLPGMDGQDVLKEIRSLEEKEGILGLDGVKVIMTTALGDAGNITQAFNNQCEGYVVKPINADKLRKQMTGLGLITEETV